jgi:hypothetical protein
VSPSTAIVGGLKSLQTALDDGGWTDRTTYELSAGVHRVHATATDQISNTLPRSTAIVRVDTAPPADLDHEIDGVAGERDWWVSESANVSLSASDNLSGVDRIEYRVDDGPWTMYDGPFPVDEEGVHEVSFRATDRAGHTGPVETFPVKIDATDPTAALVAPAPGSVYAGGTEQLELPTGPAYVLEAKRPATSGALAIQARGADATSGLYELRAQLNGSAFGEPRSSSPATWTWTTSTYPAGGYLVGVQVEDEAGNRAEDTRRVVLASATQTAAVATAQQGPSTELGLDPVVGLAVDAPTAPSR